MFHGHLSALEDRPAQEPPGFVACLLSEAAYVTEVEETVFESVACTLCLSREGSVTLEKHTLPNRSVELVSADGHPIVGDSPRLHQLIDGQSKTVALTLEGDRHERFQTHVEKGER